MRNPLTVRFVTSTRRSSNVLAVAILVAITWYASFTASAESRLVDFAWLAQAESGGGLARVVARLWSAVCAVPWRADLVIAVVQAACIPVCVALLLRRTASVVVACAAAAALLAISLPAQWLGRPLGVLSACAVLGSVVVFVSYAEGRARRAMLLAAFVAALSAGWPIILIVVLALSRRDRMAAGAVVTGALGVVARVLLGIPALSAIGAWSASEPYAFLGLRVIFWTVVLTPALLFVVTRPLVREYLQRFLGERTLITPALASIALGIAGTFLVNGGAAIFAACAVLLVVLAVSVAKVDSPAVRTGAVAFALVAVTAGIAHRVQHPPPDDAASVAGDQRAVRDAAALNGSLIVVDRGDEAVSRRFPPFVLRYLAARPIAVQYAAQPPPATRGGVVEAVPGGLIRIDPSVRAMHALDEARRSVRYDLYAHRSDGVINSRQHEATPSGLGVVPSFSLAGPYGQVPTITVLSGYAYTFDHIAVSPGWRLVFVATKPLPTGNAARATVTITYPGQHARAYDTDVPPADPSGIAAWRFASIPLNPPRTTFARIVLSASSPSGSNFGDWVSFGAPSIVGAPPDQRRPPARRARARAAG